MFDILFGFREKRSYLNQESQKNIIKIAKRFGSKIALFAPKVRNVKKKFFENRLVGPCPNICLSVCLFVCLFVCLSGGYRPQFSTYGLENLDSGPPHHWEEAFFGIFQNFDFKDPKKIK